MKYLVRKEICWEKVGVGDCKLSLSECILGFPTLVKF